MAKKKISHEEQLQEYCSMILERKERWTRLNEEGGSDPFWSDGVNMNLVRNHMIYYKEKIREICRDENLPFPEGYHIPVPPHVDNSYMAAGQKERIRKFRERDVKVTTRKSIYDEKQLSFTDLF